ncbi:MAG: hypothetical protein J6Q48_01240 [Bacteroidaceae bacterium]|nr:hypothetical protein [Bacteroidaceae bacterium]
MVRSSRSQQTKETKAVIAKAKRDIDNGRNYKEVFAEVNEKITDSLQRSKAIKSIIDYMPDVD